MGLKIMMMRKKKDDGYFGEPNNEERVPPQDPLEYYQAFAMELIKKIADQYPNDTELGNIMRKSVTPTEEPIKKES
tara:strand:- start:7 stop:234 length:228 start_codon:yes stop_codon:yes gene_type:complete